MNAASPRPAISHWMETLRPRVQPAVQAVGCPLEPLLSPALARPVDLKTSTGFTGGEATVADVASTRQVVGDRLGVLAAGGVRTLDDARTMVAAGATRLGTSAGVNIARQAQGETAAAVWQPGY